MAEDIELSALAAAGKALEGLDEAARARALTWLWHRFGGGTPLPRAATATNTAVVPPTTQGSFETFAELFDAATPKSEKEKALVAAYWAQICQGQPSFGAQSLNSNLKDLGHGLGNITDSLEALKAEKPALILQLKKSGTSKQARKTYKLTQEGSRRVNQMIAQEES